MTTAKLDSGWILVWLLAVAFGGLAACSGPQRGLSPEQLEAIPRTPDSTGTYVLVDRMPKLIGGIEGLQAALRYPASAKAEGRQGRVVLQMVIDEEGDLEMIRVAQSAGADLDAEAIRVVLASRWTPGEQRGVPVKVKMSLPVTFKLSRGSARRTRSRG